jgi:hypothetical protein
MAEGIDSTQQTSASSRSTNGSAAGPVGRGDYEVQPGDCIDSIAFRHGHFWKTIWNHPDNQQLKSARKDPNVLLAGDRVSIPDLRPKQESGATEQRHRFKRKGVPAKLRVKFYRPVAPEPDENSGGGRYDPSHYEGPPPPQPVECEPIANAPFILNVDGRCTQDQSDGEGLVDVPIPPDASVGTIKFYPGMPEEVSFDVSLGGMDPIDTVIGVRKRLNNLGYTCLPVGDEVERSLRDALRQFQTAQDLTTSGEIDRATKDKLKEVHGS